MKITIKKNGTTVYFQEVAGNTTITNKVMAEIISLKEGDTDEVILENNGHTIPLKTKDVDVLTFVKLLNGIIIKKATEAKAPTTEAAAA
jgi:DNA-binding protein